MLSENDIQTAAAELIINSCSEPELTENIEKLRAALHNGCETQKHISLLKSQVKRTVTSFNNGITNPNDFDSKINKIQKNLLDLIYGMKLHEIAIPFEYDEREKLVYHFYNFEGELIFKYHGKLQDNLPHGEGIAKYSNGTYFKGIFYKGKRNGAGELVGKNGQIIKEGTWKNDVFIEKNIVLYYPNLKVAANLLTKANSITGVDISTEIIKIPNITTPELLAFPVVGNSMEPNFSEDDIVICKKVNDPTQIVNNAPYVVFHDEDFVLKLVQKTNLNNVFQLISHNYLKYHPFEIEANEYTIFFKVVSQIRYFK